MKAAPGHQHRSAVSIVSRIIYVLEARRNIDTPPQVRGVIGLEDVFPAIIEPAVTEEEAQSAVSKIDLVVLGDGIGHERDSCAIEAAMPPWTLSLQTSDESLVDFGISERFCLAVVPSQTAERYSMRCETLLHVDPEAILARNPPGMVRDIRRGDKMLFKLRDSLAVYPHIGVIHVRQQAHDPGLVREQAVPQFVLEVLGMHLPRLPIQ